MRDWLDDALLLAAMQGIGRSHPVETGLIFPLLLRDLFDELAPASVREYMEQPISACGCWNLVIMGAFLTLPVILTAGQYQYWRSGYYTTYSDLAQRQRDRLGDRRLVRRLFASFRRACECARARRELRKKADEHRARRVRTLTFEHWLLRPEGVAARQALARLRAAAGKNSGPGATGDAGEAAPAAR